MIITFDEGASGDNQPGGDRGRGRPHRHARDQPELVWVVYAAPVTTSPRFAASRRRTASASSTTRATQRYGDITPAFADGACGRRRHRHHQRRGDQQPGRHPLAGATVTCTCNGNTTDRQQIHRQLLVHQRRRRHLLAHLLGPGVRHPDREQRRRHIGKHHNGKCRAGARQRSTPHRRSGRGGLGPGRGHVLFGHDHARPPPAICSPSRPRFDAGRVSRQVP